MIERHQGMDHDLVTFEHDGLKECFLNLRPGASFASLSQNGTAGLDWAALRRVLNLGFGAPPRGWPDGPALALRGMVDQWLGGTQLLAIDGKSGRPVTPVVLDGRCLGYAYDDGQADVCFLSGLTPRNVQASPAEQARDCFAQLALALAQAGLAPADLVRTWFYLDHLLEWYDAFNRERDAFFREWAVFDRFPPASTGIGLANRAGAALLAGAWAVRPHTAGCRIAPVVSPLQCPALDYRRSFSRAVEVTTPRWRRLIISGTASIGPDGRTLYAGDPDRQIEQTLAVCAALLESGRMGWPQVVRAIAYLTDPGDARRVAPILRRHGLGPLPLTLAEGHVCRADLLFEIELDAVAVTDHAEAALFQ